MFIFRYTLEGTTPQYESVPCAVQANASNALGINSSGYIDASSDCTAADTETVIGVTEGAVDNSGGSAGDLFQNVIVNPSAVFQCEASDGMVAANVWKNVAVNTGGLTIITDTDTGSKTGVVKIRKYISTTYCLGSINRCQD